MAAIAGHLAVPACEREIGFAVLEFRHFLPGRNAVAGPAIPGGAVRTRLRHPLGELALVRICVASGAGAALESEPARGCAGLFPPRVAFRANDRAMGACQGEPRRLVPGQCEGRGRKSVRRMAGFALSLVWRRGELARMTVCMAGGAAGVLDPVDRGFGTRQMTLSAAHRRVPSVQWVLRVLMLRHVECRRFESFDFMAGGAFSAVRTIRKLVLVGARRMTIQATAVRHGLLEIACLVAGFAGDGRVPARQRELRAGMVEHGSDSGRLPSRGGMTGPAGRLECAAVWFIVTGRAVLE